MTDFPKCVWRSDCPHDAVYDGCCAACYGERGWSLDRHARDLQILTRAFHNDRHHDDDSRVCNACRDDARLALRVMAELLQEPDEELPWQCEARWPRNGDRETGYSCCLIFHGHEGLHVRSNGDRWGETGDLIPAGAG